MRTGFILWAIVMLWMAASHVHYVITFAVISIILFVLHTRRAARLGRETAARLEAENRARWQAPETPPPSRSRSRGRGGYRPFTSAT